MAPGALVLFLIMLGALYWLTRREQAQYGEMSDVMEEETAGEPDHPNSVWEGTVDGYEVNILRGQDIRDSNRSITIQVPSDVEVRFRLDPNNALRSLSRRVEELLSNQSRLDLDGFLSDMIGYGQDPDRVNEFLRPWNNQETVRTLETFHHVRAAESGMEAQFYQGNVDQQDIRNRTEKFVRLCKVLDLPRP